MGSGDLTPSAPGPCPEEFYPALQAALLSWYRAAKRDLPFRLSRDPYHIWLSEIMAQQTRITALLPYFSAFIEKFPTIRDLACATEDEVLKAWEGLGYYSRARHLRDAAILVCDQYGGALPEDPEVLRTLPGVGAYTAGAIASIAFSKQVAAVDGNVIRVHARIRRDAHDAGSPEARAAAGTFCLALLPRDNPGDMTQALMELGALVCLPRRPKCGDCPVSELCAAHRAGVECDYPRRTPKKEKRVENRPVFLVLDEDDRVLMRRRTETLLRGMWEYPAVLPSGLEVLSEAHCGVAAHMFTHIRWEMEGRLCRVQNITAPDGYVWVEKEAFGDLAVPSAFRTFTEVLRRAFSGEKA